MALLGLENTVARDARDPQRRQGGHEVVVALLRIRVVDVSRSFLLALVHDGEDEVGEEEGDQEGEEGEGPGQAGNKDVIPWGKQSSFIWVKFLADLGKARSCSTNTVVIHGFIILTE